MSNIEYSMSNIEGSWKFEIEHSTLEIQN